MRGGHLHELDPCSAQGGDRKWLCLLSLSVSLSVPPKCLFKLSNDFETKDFKQVRQEVGTQEPEEDKAKPFWEMSPCVQSVPL